MSGFYNNWVKVENPDKILGQMTSDGFKPPFFFGGSQVPTALDLNGKPFKSGYKSSQEEVKYISGKGIQCTTVEKNNNIRIPRHMK